MPDIWSNYRSRSGHRFNEMGLDEQIREQLATIDPAHFFRIGQRDGEFRDFDTEKMAIALRGAVNAAVAEVMGDPEFDVRGYGEELVEAFERTTRR